MIPIFFQLARYLNRPYWEQRQEESKTAVATAPSAPVGGPDPTPASAPPSQQVAAQPIYAQSTNRVQEVSVYYTNILTAP